MRITLFLLLLLSLAACSSKKGGGGSSTSTSTSTSTVPPTGSASVQLSWTASTGTPNGYYVEESDDGANFTLVQTVSTNSALIGSLASGHTYYFRVAAYGPGGTSGYSNVFSITP